MTQSARAKDEDRAMNIQIFWDDGVIHTGEGKAMVIVDENGRPPTESYRIHMQGHLRPGGSFNASNDPVMEVFIVTKGDKAMTAKSAALHLRQLADMLLDQGVWEKYRGGPKPS